jgi:hypothetical protein
MITMVLSKDWGLGSTASINVLLPCTVEPVDLQVFDLQKPPESPEFREFPLLTNPATRFAPEWRQVHSHCLAT